MKESLHIFLRHVAWTGFAECQKLSIVFRLVDPILCTLPFVAFIFDSIICHFSSSFRNISCQCIQDLERYRKRRLKLRALRHPHPRRSLSNNKLHQICTTSSSSSPPSSTLPSPFQLYKTRRLTSNPAKNPAPSMREICNTRKNSTKAFARGRFCKRAPAIRCMMTLSPSISTSSTN